MKAIRVNTINNRKKQPGDLSNNQITILKKQSDEQIWYQNFENEPENYEMNCGQIQTSWTL